MSLIIIIKKGMNTKNDKMAGYGISYNIDIAFIRAMSMLK